MDLFFNETILVCVDKLEYDLLQSVSKQFCDDFDRAIEQRYRSVVIGSCWSIILRDEGDER